VELYGIEVSQSAVSATTHRAVRGLRECRLFDGSTIPYEDDRFDLVILSHVVEHLEYPRRLLYEARRVGRLVFVEVPLEDNLRLRRDFVLDGVGHLNFYSPRTIRHLLQSCDLVVLRQTVLNASYPVYRHQYGSKAWLRFAPKALLLRLAPRIAPSLWTYNCALLCAPASTSPKPSADSASSAARVAGSSENRPA
jgi:SAM-dependent methyltransferase